MLTAPFAVFLQFDFPLHAALILMGPVVDAPAIFALHFYKIFL